MLYPLLSYLRLDRFRGFCSGTRLRLASLTAARAAMRQLNGLSGPRCRLIFTLRPWLVLVLCAPGGAAEAALPATHYGVAEAKQ